MTDERVEEYYKGFMIVADFCDGDYQAKATQKTVGWLSVGKCSNVEDALDQIREFIDMEENRNRVKIREGTIELHRQFLLQRGKEQRGIKPFAQFVKVNHCFLCKYPLNNRYDIECLQCDWIICSNCGACKCGYPGAG